MACEHKDRVRAVAEGELDGEPITGITVEVCRECHRLCRVGGDPDFTAQFGVWGAWEEWRDGSFGKGRDRVALLPRARGGQAADVGGAWAGRHGARALVGDGWMAGGGARGGAVSRWRVDFLSGAIGGGRTALSTLGAAALGYVRVVAALDVARWPSVGRWVLYTPEGPVVQEVAP